MKHLLVIVILTFVVYANSLNGNLVFDDQQLITHNPRLINIRSFSDVLSLLGGARQLLTFTYGLNFYLTGLSTFSYHLFNVVLHAINSILVYHIILAVGRGIPNRTFIALSGACVFATHTLLTSAVSYIAGRSSVLCATFYFASTLAFIKAFDADQPKKRALCAAASVVMGFLAWQTKQEAITLPLFLASIVFLRSETLDWRWLAPLAAAPIAVLFLMRDELAALYSNVMSNTVLVAAGFERVLEPAVYFRTYINAMVAYYIPRMAAPVLLSVDPHIPEVSHWYSPEFLFSVLGLAGLAAFALRYKKQEPLLSVGVAALLVSPMSAYVAIPLADVVQEHRAYIPALGAALLFAGAFRWISRNHARYCAPAVLAVVAVLSLMTIVRNSVWANSVNLWSDAEQKSPGKARAHFNLGQAYQEVQRLPEAVNEYQHALELKPDIHAAYSNMAAIYLDTGQLDKGEQTLLKVTQIAPDFSEGFINLAVLYLRRQQPEKALDAVDRAIMINPESAPAHYNRGEILLGMGAVKEALKSYERATYLRPDLPSFRMSLASAQMRGGESVAAEATLQALTSGATAPEAYRQLGAIYSQRGNMEKAIEFLEHAVRFQPVFPDAHHDLAVIYLQKSAPAKAIDELQTVLMQKPDFAPAVLNLALAYQINGDLNRARQTLSEYLQKYGRVNSPFIPQIQQRLAALGAN